MARNTNPGVTGESSALASASRISGLSGGSVVGFSGDKVKGKIGPAAVTILANVGRASGSGPQASINIATWPWRFARAASDINWNELQVQGALFGDLNAAGYQARIEGLPTTGGVTINPGDSISTALANNNTVFLNPGTYNLSPSLNIGANKKLLCKSGVARLQFTVANGNNMIMMSAANSVLAGVGDGVIEVTSTAENQNNGVCVWGVDNTGGADGVTLYHVAVTGPISFNGGGAGISAFYGAKNTLICSCQVVLCHDTTNAGGNTDGFSAGFNTLSGASNAFVDCHAYENSDDGFDFWLSSRPQYIYYGTSHRQARSGLVMSGDGNGLKLGKYGPGVVHYVYKHASNDNKKYAFNRNANGTIDPNDINSAYVAQYAPVIKACTATGNLLGTYAGSQSDYNVL